MRTSSLDRQADWTRLLLDAVEQPGLISKAYSTFWSFSAGNQLAALMQCLLRSIKPGPLHTYKGWQRVNRFVKRGEKALTLVMPITTGCRVHDPPDANGIDDDSASQANAQRILFVERPYWFTLSQTDGEPYQPVEQPAWSEALALKNLLIERIPFDRLDGNVQGFARNRSVAISPIAFLPARTLLHEVAHVLLGHTTEGQSLTDNDERTPRDVREVEAECVALLCCASLNLGGEVFSRGYIQCWLRDRTIETKSVHRIFKAADAILGAGRAENAPPPAELDAPAA